MDRKIPVRTILRRGGGSRLYEAIYSSSFVGIVLHD